jgi:hypothetical protein
MFKQFQLEATRRVFVLQYCRGAFAECERKKARDAGKPVPDRLLPDGQTFNM